MNKKILALTVAIIVIVAASGVIARQLLQTKNKANNLPFSVTIDYYCEAVENDNGVIRVVATANTNYISFNSTFGVSGYDFYLKDGNQPKIPQISMITEGGTSGFQNMVLYNNCKFELDFYGNGDPSDYHLVFSGGDTVAAENGVLCNLKLVDQTK